MKSKQCDRTLESENIQMSLLLKIELDGLYIIISPVARVLCTSRSYVPFCGRPTFVVY